MPCVKIGNAIVCTPTVTRIEKHRYRCPTCKTRTTFLCEFAEWYGWTKTCLRCGDAWDNGEMLPRPFKPGWRKESIEWAKQRWARRRR